MWSWVLVKPSGHFRLVEYLLIFTEKNRFCIKPRFESESFRTQTDGLFVDSGPGGGGGGHLGIFWVGMCRPGLQIGTPF